MRAPFSSASNAQIASIISGEGALNVEDCRNPQPRLGISTYIDYIKSSQYVEKVLQFSGDNDIIELSIDVALYYILGDIFSAHTSSSDHYISDTGDFLY